MINEKLEVMDYLNGKNLNKENLYHTYYQIAKYFKEQGLPRTEIRNAIFYWANENGIFVKHDLNAIITAVFEDREPLREKMVKINRTDIEEITRLFDNPKTRLTALGLLCYAKAYGNRNGEFHISSVTLGVWLGIHRTQLKRRYMRELMDYGYLDEIQRAQNTYTWSMPQTNRYRINAPIHNSGHYVLEGNDIQKLYREIFPD